MKLGKSWRYLGQTFGLPLHTQPKPAAKKKQYRMVPE